MGLRRIDLALSSAVRAIRRWSGITAASDGWGTTTKNLNVIWDSISGVNWETWI